MSKEQGSVSRRGVLAGLGVASAAAMLAPMKADAAPATHGPGAAGLEKGQQAVPAGLTPIASTPASGTSYRFLDMWDFTPENFSSGRSWTGNGGVYTAAAADTLWASADFPPGAVLADVEWYVASTVTTGLLARVWVAGTATLFTAVADGTITAGPAGVVRAVRITAPAAANGPFPHGTKLTLGITTPSNGTVAVNGARVGFRLTPTGEVLLPAPVRIYDSRTGGGAKIASGATRIHSLSSQLPIGATGAILNVTVTGTEHTGYLKVYSSAAAVPTASTMNWFGAGQTLANGVETTVASTRSIKVTCGGSSAKTHYIVDLVGYLA